MRTNAFMALSVICSMMAVWSIRMYIEYKKWVFMVYAGVLISGAAFMAALAVSMHE